MDLHVHYRTERLALGIKGSLPNKINIKAQFLVRNDHIDSFMLLKQLFHVINFVFTFWVL